MPLDVDHNTYIPIEGTAQFEVVVGTNARRLDGTAQWVALTADEGGGGGPSDPPSATGLYGTAVDMDEEFFHPGLDHNTQWNSYFLLADEPWPPATDDPDEAMAVLIDFVMAHVVNFVDTLRPEVVSADIDWGLPGVAPATGLVRPAAWGNKTGFYIGYGTDVPLGTYTMTWTLRDSSSAVVDTVTGTYEVVAPLTAPAAAAAAYNPGDHTVAEVLAYVDEHPGERLGILFAELTGKQRSTLIDSLRPS